VSRDVAGPPADRVVTRFAPSPTGHLHLGQPTQRSSPRRRPAARAAASSSPSTAVGNTIRGNPIHANGGKAIAN
jgi:hypothetical protein